jgi:hypothetical protein
VNRADVAMLCIVALVALAACETQRIEYHRRPAFHHRASMGELPDRVTLDDGTTIIFHSGFSAPRHDARRTDVEDGERKLFQIREEHEDGTITLRAILPEHIISNLLTCLQNEEYELIYDELLSQHTRDAWEAEGNDVDDFIEFFSANRPRMLQMLNRLYLGMSSFETIMEKYDDGVIECRLRSSGGRGLQFTRVRMIPEGFGLKLLNVR